MVLAVVLVTVGIPGVLYLQDQWGANLPLSWREVGDSRIHNGTVDLTWPDGTSPTGEVQITEEIGSEAVQVHYYDIIAPNGARKGYYQMDTPEITWDLGGNDTDVIVLENDTAYYGDWSAETIYQRLYWITRYNGSSILEDDIWKIKYEIDTNRNFTLNLGLIDVDLEGVVNLDDTVRIWTSGEVGDNDTGIISYDILDVLEARSALGEGKLALWIELDEGEAFEVGDIIEFRIWVVKESGTLITQSTITTGSLVLITLVLGYVAVASTPWYNPTDPKNPGWIGKRLSGLNRTIQGFLARRSKRRRSRR